MHLDFIIFLNQKYRIYYKYTIFDNANEYTMCYKYSNLLKIYKMFVPKKVSKN